MNIKEIRSGLSLSQSQFATKFNIPVRTLQQWEQNKSSPPEYVVDLICKQIEYEGMIRTDYISKFRLKDHPWKICIENPFKNCEKIHPLQQKKVARLIGELKKCESVTKIIIFGSSVTNMCHLGSDIDIYAEMTYDSNPITAYFDFEYDFWNNYRVDDRLQKEIIEKGVVVYGN